MPTTRWILFAGIVLTGLALDGYWSWYPSHFAAACADSGNSVPPSFPIFVVGSLLPAAFSFPFRRSPAFTLIGFCAASLHALIQLYAIAQSEAFGVNCYRDIGSGQVGAMLLLILLSILLVTVTVAFGLVWVMRRWLAASSPRSSQ
jgi:hypothetical protein